MQDHPLRGQRRAASGALKGAGALALGGAIGGAIMSYPEDIRRPHLGHWRYEPSASRAPRRGLISKKEWDNAFPRPADRRSPGPVEDAQHRIRPRKRAIEGCRTRDVKKPSPEGAIADVVAGGAKPKIAHRFYHVPASNTAVGHLILENAA